MTRALTEPTAALTVVGPRHATAVVEDPADLDEGDITDVLAQHDQRALLFGVAAGLLCGPLCLVAVEATWLAPFIASVAAGVGGVVGQVVRRRQVARELGIAEEAIAQVEAQWTPATVDLLREDIRRGRWAKLLLRGPRENREELAPRIRARLVARARRG